MADYIKSKGIAGIKMSQEVNKEAYEKSMRRLKKELEEMSSAFNIRRNQINDEISNLESQLKGTREEYETKTKWIKEFETKREIVSSLLSAKEKEYKDFMDRKNGDKQKLEMELIKIQESIANCEKEIKDLDESISGKRDYFHTLERDVTSLEDLYLENIENVNALNQDIGNLTIALKEAENIISYARIVEIGLEKREATLSKKEDICEVRRRSLERMFERKLGINIKNKFYGKNI